MAALVALAVIAAAMIPVSAGMNKESVFSDSFSASALDADAWETTGGAAVKDYGGGISLVGGDFGTSVGWKGLRDVVDNKGKGDGLTADYALEVTVSRDMLASQWLAVYVGCDEIAKRFNALSDSDGARGSVLVFENGSVTHYVGQGKLATDDAAVVAKGDETAQANAVSRFVLPAGKTMTNDGARYCIKLVAHFGESANTRRWNNSLDVYIAPEPENRTDDTLIDYGEKVATVHYVNVEGYFGFGSLNSGVATVSKIKVTDVGSGEVLYRPAGDLKGNLIEHIVGTGKAEYRDREFRVWNTTSGQYDGMIFSGPLGKLELTGESSALLRSEVKADDSVYSLYNVDFSLNARAIGEGGLDVVLAKTESGESAVTVSSAADKLVFSDGRTSVERQLTGAHKYSFRLKSDGRAEMYADGGKVGEFSGFTVFGGRVGLRASAGTKAEIDDFSVVAYRAANSSAASACIDFTLKDESGVSYLDDEVWYLSGNAMKLKGYDEIAFINAKGGSMISTRQKYADYVVKFDLTDVSQDDMNMIIMCFGKSSHGDTFKVSPAIILAPRSKTTGTVTDAYTNVEALNGLAFATGSSSVRLEDNIYGDMNETTGHTVLNVMLIVKNRSVTFFYKFGDEPASELARPRAVIEDVDTYGHFSIESNNIANFSVKNLSVINLDANRGFIAE